MSAARPYLPAGCDQQGRVPQTALQAWEDAAGTCNTCPSELEPAECLQRDPGPPPYPWRDLGAGVCVLFGVVAAAHLVAIVCPAVLQVAAR